MYGANNYVCLICMYAVLPDIMLMCFDRLRCEFFILLRGNFFVKLGPKQLVLTRFASQFADTHCFALRFVLSLEP